MSHSEATRRADVVSAEEHLMLLQLHESSCSSGDSGSAGGLDDLSPAPLRRLPRP